MACKYPHVFDPFEIRGVLFKNHLEQAPPGCFFSGDDRGFVTDDFVSYFRQYARGGVAVCNVGNCSIDITESSDEARQLQLSDPECVMPLRKFAEMCAVYGAHGSLELTHNGKDTAFENVGHAPYSASSFITKAEERRAKMLGREPIATIEMSKEKIRETVEKYARAARFCKEAGMQICMIHGAHGNLIAQFASPYYNRRSDEYGGSLKNRARFACEVLEAVRGAVGENFVIEYRLSADEHHPEQMRFPETLEFIKYIKDKTDILHVSAGLHDLYGEPWYLRYLMSNYTMPQQLNVHFSEAVKRAYPDLTVAVVGAIKDPGQAEEIIASGKADFVSMCRPLLADPEMPRKYAEGREEDHRPCLRCQRCAPPEHRIISCSVNPFLGREREFPLGRVQKADTKRKVAVVGGGPGGITAAQILCMRGHDVTLYEKTGKLGGQLKYAALPTFKQDVADYLKYLERQANKCGAKVLLNTEATREMLEKENYDAVIVAIGAEPIIPKLPGIDLPHVVWAPEADAGEKPCGQKVVVVGAGAVGMEAAIDLKKEGKDVTVIELLDNWSSLQKSASGGAAEFFAIIKELELDVRLGHKLLEVTPAEVICEDVKTGEPVRIPADSVLLAMGVKPRWAEADQLRLAAPGTNCFLIGDCLYVGDNIKGATSGALSAAAYL